MMALPAVVTYLLATVTLLLIPGVQGGAIPPVERRATTVTQMTAAQESSYRPAALFASAAYCHPAETITWSLNCEAIPGFVPYGTGGDGDLTQYWYVGYDPAYFEAIVIGHQGTNTSLILPIVTDIEFVPLPLSPSLFPGIPITVQAHSGFEATHARSAWDVLAAVRKAQAATGSTKVVIAGHSLGAAIALLDAVYLPLHLPKSTTFTTTLFGLPRVGNQAFANYVDQHVTSFAHITNKLDPVPTLPPRLGNLGFVHPSNEKHIVISGTSTGDWYACDGQDNTSVDCSTGAVPDTLAGNTDDHDGPYGAVYMGGCKGPDKLMS